MGFINLEDIFKGNDYHRGYLLFKGVMLIFVNFRFAIRFSINVMVFVDFDEEIHI